MTHWSRSYLGLPYADRGRSRAGVDCWGLPFLAFPEQLRIDVPEYAGATVGDAERRELEALMAGEDVDTWAKVADPQPFDLVWFRNLRSGDATHVGIVMRPGLMLHAYRGEGCVVPQDYTARTWSTFLIGVYRHREMLERQHAA